MLDRLRRVYTEKLGKGPFPTADCSTAKLTGREHGILTLYLAGIASHGKKLQSITEARRIEFREMVARSFEEKWPATYAKITRERTPTLFRLLKDTEDARLLIVSCLDR
jgi:hypothetical protein